MTKNFLFNALVNHRNMHRVSLHTPGHKNKFQKLNELWDLDYTELPDTDSLFEASGAILASEKFASKIFNTNKTLFSAEGCTLCIQAMLRLVAEEGDKVLFGRTIHRSAINTVALLGIDPIYVMPRRNAGQDLPGRIEAKDVEDVLISHDDIKAVYITSPDYFGVISDVAAISSVCKKFSVPLIVDNAHGTHLKFLSDDIHPITLGASLSADSAHKTLPVFTGGALLQIADEKYVSDSKDAMQLFASTSPSYPIMASLDVGLHWIEKFGRKAYGELAEKVSSIRSELSHIGVSLPEGVCDPIRLSINTASVGISGIDAAEYLRKNAFEPEYANTNYIVLILTPFVDDEQIAKLAYVLKLMVDKCFFQNLESKNRSRDFLFDLPKKIFTPRKALFGKTYTISIDEAYNKICAQVANVCPPGIPVVMPGELITLDTIKILKESGFRKIKIIV